MPSKGRAFVAGLDIPDKNEKWGIVSILRKFEKGFTQAKMASHKKRAAIPTAVLMVIAVSVSISGIMCFHLWILPCMPGPVY
jgi:hypothetical protein